jgi:hypothetical protein
MNFLPTNPDAKPTKHVNIHAGLPRKGETLEEFRAAFLIRTNVVGPSKTEEEG